MSKNILLRFFDRPSEPCFMQKDGFVFELPTKYFPEIYQPECTTLSKRFAAGAQETICINDIALPDLSLPMELSYYDQFSFLLPRHREMACKLIEIFMNMSNLNDLVSICAYAQIRINPYMFNYCLSVATQYREDTKGLNIPHLADTFPGNFVDPTVFRSAREESTVVPEGERWTIVIPQNYTAAASEPEQRVAYFREDIGVNLHYWHWNLVYPTDAANESIVDKDRRGELLYYMNQQIMARYTAERLCNDLGYTRQFSDFKSPIEEGYFSKLDAQVASSAWPPRYADTFIHDLNRTGNDLIIDVRDLELWRDRIIRAIDDMAILLPSGELMPLDEETGIDILGNIIQSSMLSPNRYYYGDLLNMGHLFIAYAHDPDDRYLEPFSVMGDTATAMRDPAFYRWHAHVDDLFRLYKNKLPPYPGDKLDFPGIEVISIEIKSRKHNNIFTTRWEESTVNLSRGLDFVPRGAVLASYTHLQHENFDYVIVAKNKSSSHMTGTVRIFMAPTLDEKGSHLSFDDQRRLMIELDKFTVELPAGTKHIERRSEESSVTIPYERTFPDKSNRPDDSIAAAEFDFCGCGWPHHMLIPKGTDKGYPVVVFCMISNWADCRVGQTVTGECKNASSYCGIRDSKYPDRYAMGYPFDRPAKVSKLADFLTPNMAIQECEIRFTNKNK